YRPSGGLLKAIEFFSALAVAAALACAALLIGAGPGTSAGLGSDGFGLSARLDGVSAAMLLLVTFIGWIVVRFSVVYLDGEARQGAFMA
ncbi:oxidoreductase, partial [Pseudomonas sp. GW704-F2]